MGAEALSVLPLGDAANILRLRHLSKNVGNFPRGLVNADSFCIVPLMSEANPLKQYRDTSEISQEKLGELIGVDGNTIARWERGDHLPQKKFWSKIAEVTGITAAQLVGHREAAQ